MSSLPLIARASEHSSSIAFRCPDAEYSYQQLLDQSATIATVLLDGQTDLQQARVAYLVGAGIHHTAIQWGIWRSGGVAVPLSLSATRNELHYAVSDSRASVVVTDGQLASQVAELCQSLGLRLLTVEEILLSLIHI